jgi:hypothetical protein
MASYSNIKAILENEDNFFWRNKLNAIYDYVLDHLNSLRLFKSNKYNLSYESNPGHSGYILRLGSLESNNLCIIEYGKLNYNTNQVETASINFVTSNLGFSTGQFLFYIQLLCAYLYGIKQFKLENETNNQVRASKGIYKLFRPYLTNEKRNLFSDSINELTNIENKISRYNTLSNDNIQNILSKINGEMELKINSEFPNLYLNEMKKMLNKIIEKKNNMNNVWNIPNLPSLLILCRNLLNISNFNTTISRTIKYKKDKMNKKTIVRGKINGKRPQTRSQSRLHRGGKNKTRKHRN